MSRIGIANMAQFEYKVVSQMSGTTQGGRDWSWAEKSINELAAERWEVVSSNVTSIGGLVFGCGSMEPMVTFVLRRPLQQ
jgi:hypothetical protein